ncbi:MAG: helix-turn-helix transcriptional regulator [Tyzzerella sp.]|nr:helix-turn-helix transcriptional regulator [Tyzzerella sp.]
MAFNENLQNLRKMKGMSQEQLAEQLEVSRQAVSKWESGSGYPETEKLIAICEIFDCSIDALLKGKITADSTGEKNKYENLQNRFSKGISLGVGIILLGVTILLYLAGVANMAETAVMGERYAMLGVVILLCCVAIAVPVFIMLGIEKENFDKKHPQLPYFYQEDEVESFDKKFMKAIALGVVLILVGVIVLISLTGMRIVNDESTLPVVILMGCVTTAVTIFTYFGLQKDKYDIERYNRMHTEEGKKREEISGKICGVIMLTATAIFLASGLIFDLWKMNWVVFPIGGIACGIVATILEKE